MWTFIKNLMKLFAKKGIKREPIWVKAKCSGSLAYHYGNERTKVGNYYQDWDTRTRVYANQEVEKVRELQGPNHGSAPATSPFSASVHLLNLFPKNRRVSIPLNRRTNKYYNCNQHCFIIFSKAIDDIEHRNLFHLFIKEGTRGDEESLVSIQSRDISCSWYLLGEQKLILYRVATSLLADPPIKWLCGLLQAAKNTNIYH